ncbi:MAG TPA: Zn-dependent hydrolase [Cytophagales bacterium]|jgi:hypothetical protein|nr:Zn-dependent hydrolase [Cytophagales bacterium]
MKRIYTFLAISVAIGLFLGSCKSPKQEEQQVSASLLKEGVDISNKLSKYTAVPLTTDLTVLSKNQQKMIPILIEVADIMDELFWYEAYGKKDSLMELVQNEDLKKYLHINYGPWDRLEDNNSFVAGVGEKPKGANFYPENMSKEEFEQADLPDKKSLYTLLRRDENGDLMTVPYHEAFADQIEKAAELLEQAAELAEDEGFKNYLTLRAAALRTDEYLESDMAWMDMKTNMIDFVVGPIENYEDKLFNYKAAHEAYVLIKDMEWSKRLAKYAAFLPELQKGIPVPEAYKQEKPGSNADLNAYDVVYYAGDCNAGSKTIAINLPNDERVQLEKGSRRLQLKNAMHAKFDQILAPISEILIAEDQRQHIKFDAFFANTMFHEVAHGLGIKNTITGKGAVRSAMKEHSSALEEGKADILGLYMINQLMDKGELDGDIKDYYVTFLAGIFRSVRFGAASAHGQANMVRFNFFKEMEAFDYDSESKTYRVNFDKMQDAVGALSEKILTIQGDGDYEAAGKLLNEMGVITSDLQRDLDRLSAANIPVDIVFEQGSSVLGL